MHRNKKKKVDHAQKAAQVYKSESTLSSARLILKMDCVGGLVLVPYGQPVQLDADVKLLALLRFMKGGMEA